MQPAIDELIKHAMSVQGHFPFPLLDDLGAGGAAAALKTSRGDVFTGICIDLPCGIGFCAEHSAVAEMLKARQTSIDMIVCVGSGGTVLPPCGRCRELLYLVNPDNAGTQVVVGPRRILSLKELLPEHWLSEMNKQ